MEKKSKIWTHVDFVCRKLERYFDDELENALNLINEYDNLVPNDWNTIQWRKIIGKELKKRRLEKEIEELQNYYLENVIYTNNSEQ
jgi:hypothetical protein